ncbi:TonB-dependent receptor domain-containing protein [Dokdonella soli]|uniref:TonB-dependent receptor n=1 Tax=Dokdonella soli TaxID=529810 RepID=A0ABN1IGL6_9GAMM
MNQRLLVSCIIVALTASLSLGSVHAQSAGDQAAQGQTQPDESKPKSDETARLGVITVTGSRISNPNVVSPTPISVLTAADIQAVGAINIGDILTRMPQLATTFTMGNSGQGQIGTAGLALQDLRNLGPQRTLVLVNGRRYVSSSTDFAAVDTNLIPADWVDRVEIITGGASAIYGADAVSGVVNFILKKQYQGADLHAQSGTTSPGGEKSGFISATAGSNFAQDRGNIAFSLEHSRQDELMFHDRFGNQQYGTIRTPGSAYTRTLFPDAGSYTITEGGTFFFGSDSKASSGERYVFDPDGHVRPQRFDGIYDSSRCANCDHLNANQTIQLQPKFERTTLSTSASFDLTPSNRLYFEGSYNVIDINSKFQPAYGSVLNGGVGFAGGGYAIAADNAYIRQDLRDLMTAKGVSEVDISRFDVDSGLRIEDTRRDTGRIVLGANGVIADKWEYDTSVTYGNTRSTVANVNNRVIERFFASIDAVRDPVTGNIVCRSTIDPSHVDINTGAPISDFGRQGCIPTSIFGAGAINAAARNWFNKTTYVRNKLSETVATGSVTNNDLFNVPTGAGSASLAAGFEYRKETIQQTNDPLDQSGATFNNAIANFDHAYNVKEAFVEFGLPVLADKPFIKNLSLDAAVRESSYSTIGSTQTWKYGLDWAFDDNVRVRGTMSYAVRAPNINELYSGQSQNFFTVTDPCSASRIPNGPNPAVRAANCAALGVPPGVEIDPSASVGGVSGSNPNLGPEAAKTYTFGFVVTPQFVDGLGFNADYWNIKLKNAISAVDAQAIVDKCVDSTAGINNAYCSNLRRDPTTHQLTFIRQINLNLAGTNTSGIDFAAYYSRDLGPGKLRLDLNVTRVIDYTAFPFQDDPTQHVQDVGTDGFPEWKASLGTRYSFERWQFDWNMRYFSSMLRATISNESYATKPNQTTPITEGSRTYSDVRVAYGSQKEGWQFYGGVNNVFDRKMPVNLFGDGFGSALYEPLGRSYYVGFNYHF